MQDGDQYWTRRELGGGSETQNCGKGGERGGVGAMHTGTGVKSGDGLKEPFGTGLPGNGSAKHVGAQAS